MKVSFLDIDGVLNNEVFDEVTTLEETKILSELLRNKFRFKFIKTCLHALHHTKINIFNNFIEETGSKVVVSSAWRTMFEKDELQKVLDFRGFRAEIYDYTPILETDIHYVPRGHEIKQWIDENECVESFVIFDDRSDLQPFLNHLVHTDPSTGLKEQDMEKAKSILSINIRSEC